MSLMVSVVLATCGRQAMALECIESILANDYSEFEILVVDQDTSRTLKSELVARYGETKKIRYFFLDKKGLSRARNLGVREAQGEIVAFIDDDAIADKSWLRGIAQIFNGTDQKPAFIGGRILPIWSCLKPSWYPVEKEFLLGLYDIGDEAKLFPGSDLPIGANMAGLRQVIIDMGSFDERLGFDYSRKQSMIAGEDSMLAERIKEAGYQIYYQPVATVRHRVAKSKLSPKYFLRRHFWEGVTIVNRLMLMGKINEGNERFIISCHLRIIGKSISRIVLVSCNYVSDYILPSKKRKKEISFSAQVMLVLSEIFNSLGVIWASIDIKKKRKSKLS